MNDTCVRSVACLGRGWGAKWEGVREQRELQGISHILFLELGGNVWLLGFIILQTVYIGHAHSFVNMTYCTVKIFKNMFCQSQSFPSPMPVKGRGEGGSMV